jgi:Fe2+ or Zn2+ uptake regulation protein
MTWKEIVQAYPDQWVGITDVEYEPDNDATIASAVVLYTDKTKNELTSMQIYTNGKILGRYTTPDPFIFRLLQEADKVEPLPKYDICRAAKSIGKRFHLTSHQQHKCINFFAHISKEDRIYPGYLQSRLEIDIQTAYKFLECLKGQGYLKNLYEVYCFECNKNNGKYLESLEQFSPNLCCNFCGKHLSLDSNILVLYKVIKTIED